MQIPSTTLLTVLAALASNVVADMGIAKVADGAPAHQLKALVIAGVASNVLTAGLGAALGGVRKPNTVGRGLLWAGGIGLTLAAIEWATKIDPSRNL